MSNQKHHKEFNFCLHDHRFEVNVYIGEHEGYPAVFSEVYAPFMGESQWNSHFLYTNANLTKAAKEAIDWFSRFDEKAAQRLVDGLYKFKASNPDATEWNYDKESCSNSNPDKSE